MTASGFPPSETPASQVALLHHISGIVSSGKGLEEMLQELIGLTMEVTGCDACLVYLVDEASNEMVLRASQLPHAAEIGNIRLRAGEGVTGWVAAHNSVVALASHAWADTRFKAFGALPEDTFEAFLSVPLVSGGDLIGVINVHHEAEHAHAADEIALVSFIGEQMGGAISKSRLAERSENSRKRMETLAALAQAISAESYLDHTLQTIADMLAEALNVPACSITVGAETGEERMFSAVRTQDVENLREPLSMALVRSDRMLGAIHVYPRGEAGFTEEESGFIKVAGGQAAAAIDNARLMSEHAEMKRALEDRKVMERAKGILQQKYGMTEEEAYLRLRNESRRLRRPMRDLAEAVILAEDMHRRGVE